MKAIPLPKTHVLICCIKNVPQLTHCAHQGMLDSPGGIRHQCIQENCKNQDGNPIEGRRG